MNRRLNRVALLGALTGACGEAAPRATAPRATPEAATHLLASAPPAPAVQAEVKVAPAPLPAAVAATKPYENGDIIFHDANTEQSELVRMVTRSQWTHLGILWNEPDGVVVYEAAAPVKKTPLQAWTRRGVDDRYVVKRPSAGIEADGLERMHALMQTWLDRPYDYRFQWGDQAIYCSEFVYKVFERACGLTFGKKQMAREMALDDPVIRLAISSRWGKAIYNPEEIVVTPDSIFQDPALIEIEH